jgi:glycosyltransferase involved in cell wall biosynthesis
MQFEIIAPPVFPVPPVAGGIERGCLDLATGLAEHGHSAELLASGDSQVGHSGVRLQPVNEQSYALAGISQEDMPHHTEVAAQEVLRITDRLAAAGLVDVINQRWERPTLARALAKTGLPLIVTFSCTPRPNISESLGINGVTYTAHTQAHKESLGNDPSIVVVPYGIDMRGMTPSAQPLSQTHETPHHPLLRRLQEEGEDYLLHLARFEPGKGQHTSIEIAKAAGRKLILAGGVIPELAGSVEYFETHIRPHIDDEQIFYVNKVPEAGKIELNRFAIAALCCSGYETTYVEPFGRYVAEAPAVGTPMVGYQHGSFPELITEGVTGFGFDTIEQAAEHINQDTPGFDRMAAARHARKTLSAERFVRGIEALGAQLIAGR